MGKNGGEPGDGLWSFSWFFAHYFSGDHRAFMPELKRAKFQKEHGRGWKGICSKNSPAEFRFKLRVFYQCFSYQDSFLIWWQNDETRMIFFFHWYGSMSREKGTTPDGWLSQKRKFFPKVKCTISFPPFPFLSHHHQLFSLAFLHLSASSFAAAAKASPSFWSALRSLSLSLFFSPTHCRPLEATTMYISGLLRGPHSR